MPSKIGFETFDKVWGSKLGWRFEIREETKVGKVAIGVNSLKSPDFFFYTLYLAVYLGFFLPLIFLACFWDFSGRADNYS